ncbi:cyclophane-forming radical SAM peptide maturase AmcB [Streptomyces sp. NBC_01481]|uniref:cyclophane-forming radical SAM peptide maturase AmcB n=1 Tax=Streptomyces sp. NBC_01481 TaxID=2975869 RepID=UPI00225A7533|nr:cyclophane-forming radical SAM peptide maturase AmcB [Streptomyces sp. NBC_01481]MCX4582537.1 radical SAM protein [Streptomyces sp. NBC_01481]
MPRAVIMQPTTLCQPLDCTYCYLPFRKTKHLMPMPVAQAVADPVNRCAQDDPQFEVVWHGGEPLATGREYLAALMDPFRGVKHTLQTNAVLLDDAWCTFLLERDIGVGVSVDGPEDMNTHRVTRAGHPAYRLIKRGIDRLRHHGIPFSAIAVVSHPDPARAADLYEFFVDLGCHSLGVNIEEQEGVNVTGGQDFEQAAGFWEALTSAWHDNPVLQLREVDRVLDFAGSVLDGDVGSPPVLQAWDPLPTIAYDGGVVLISPELAGFTDERFGDFTTGNVLHTGLDVLLAEAHQRTRWLSEFWSGVDACKATCPYFSFCGGAHPANRYFEHQGRMDGTRTRYCTTSKIALFEGVNRHAHAHSH